MSIRVEGLHFGYPDGVTALCGVDLVVESGERIAIIGENGAGKTTLVRHFNGIMKPTSGRVLVNGVDTATREVSQLAREVGYVFQNPHEQLFARTVRAEVEFGPRNLGYPAGRRRRLVDWALEATRLTAHSDAHPYELSLAERKRVAIASVLAMDTPIVVLDEPTTGQDCAGVNDVGSILAQLRDSGRTVVGVTHDMDFCAENFDRVVVMARGRIVADGPTAEIFRDDAVLAEAAVEAPSMTRLTRRLGWNRSAITVEELVSRLDHRERGPSDHPHGQ
ncbi:MAG: ABC transporter ATP-binding protein [Kutzneria sp.]|nr:ABC transporter ATP-binding protein [Kutzneria sp.]